MRKIIKKAIGTAGLLGLLLSPNLTNSEEKGNLDVSKILTVSATEYVQSKGKRLTDYEFYGVGGILDWNNFEGCKEVILLKQEKGYIPKNIEVVVAYTEVTGPRYISCNGTGLIPKKSKK